MGMQKMGEESVRKLGKVAGKSYYVTLPISCIRELKWREKQKVVVKKKGNKLIIEDWKP